MTRIKKISTKQRKILNQWHKLRLKIWDSRPHQCENCGAWLPEPPQPENFSHYLPKGLYKKLELTEQNIDLLCRKCHDQWEYRDKTTMRIYDLERIAYLKRLDKEL